MASNAQFARSLERLIYQLTKQFESGPVDVYYNIVIEGDVKKGKRTITSREMRRVKRAIVMPESSVKAVIQTITKIGADKQFVWGGEYRRDERFFLLDGLQLAGVTLTVNDWLIYAGTQKYQIAKLVDYYDGALVLIRGREQPGDAFSQVHDTEVFEQLVYNESASGTL